MTEQLLRLKISIPHRDSGPTTVMLKVSGIFMQKTGGRHSMNPRCLSLVAFCVCLFLMAGCNHAGTFKETDIFTWITTDRCAA